jgi:dTDP-4-dehydrorhamnose reductase
VDNPKPQRVLLLGANGYIGSALRDQLIARGHTVLTPGSRHLDARSFDPFLSWLREFKPTFVFNSAGYTGKPNVDACELHKADCLMGNAVLPGIVAQACADAGIPWGHVSSGCIYTGARPDGSGFSETDIPNFTFRTNNCSFYSGTKALGEEVLASFPSTYIWRLRIPFNEVDGPRNYLTKLLRYTTLLEADNSISQLEEFVTATFACWEKRVPGGIYNVTNPGQVTTREVVELIKKAGISNKDFKFFQDEAEFMRTAAKTPRSNCVMTSAKLAATGIKMTEVHTAIERDLRRWVRS